jgi:hypothetical protein
MPTSPFDSTASAIAAQAASIQRAAARRSRLALREQVGAQRDVVQSVRPMSSVTMPPSAMKYGLDSSAIIAASPVSALPRRRAVKPTSSIVARPQRPRRGARVYSLRGRPERGRARPVLQRRLLEVLDAVQPRRDQSPLAAISREISE